LSSVYVHSSNGSEIPLSAFAHFGVDQTPLSVPHQGQFPAVTISFNLSPGVSLGDATNAIEAEERKMGMPSSIHPGFQERRKPFNSRWPTSDVDPCRAPGRLHRPRHPLREPRASGDDPLHDSVAGVGALIALLLTNTEFTIIALIGIILLIGIVKKNAIMMIDFALEAERKHGKSARDAIREACLLRFRPS